MISLGEKPTAYCEKCDKDVKFTTRAKQEQREVDGRSYVFRRQIAVCNKCGKEIMYPPYVYAAEQEFQKALSQSTGLVTPEQIAEIPRRYSIGKRPLSRLLGWGELTYTRLLDGRTPTQEHSDELRRILDDPAAYSRLLEQGRSQGLITDLAYQRSRRALDTILTNEHHDSTAMFSVADRFCVLSEGDLTPRALQALVYFAQGRSYAQLDEPLFDMLPRAAAYGPEYEQICDEYSFANIQAAFERATENSSASDLNEDALNLIANVYTEYGIFSGGELCRLARSQAPWRKARKRAGVTDDEDCSERITPKSMKKFFSKSK